MLKTTKHSFMTMWSIHMEESYFSIADYSEGYITHIVNTFMRTYTHHYDSYNPESFYHKQYVYSVLL